MELLEHFQWLTEHEPHIDRVIRLSGRAPGSLRFELGVRDGRPPLACYRSGDRLAERAPTDPGLADRVA